MRGRAGAGGPGRERQELQDDAGRGVRPGSGSRLNKWQRCFRFKLQAETRLSFSSHVSVHVVEAANQPGCRWRLRNRSETQ